MATNIKAIHFDISEKLVEFTNKKIDKLARRYDVVGDIAVNYTLVKPDAARNKEAGVEVNVPNQGILYASKTADSFEEALDLALDALERQLEKAKNQ